MKYIFRTISNQRVWQWAKIRRNFTGRVWVGINMEDSKYAKRLDMPEDYIHPIIANRQG